LVNSWGGPFVLPEYASRSEGGASSLHWVADGVGRNSRSIVSTTALVGMGQAAIVGNIPENWCKHGMVTRQQVVDCDGGWELYDLITLGKLCLEIAIAYCNTARFNRSLLTFCSWVPFQWM